MRLGALLRRYFESFTVVVRDDGATLIPRLRADRLLETHDGVPLLPREAPPELATSDLDGFPSASFSLSLFGPIPVAGPGATSDRLGTMSPA